MPRCRRPKTALRLAILDGIEEYIFQVLEENREKRRKEEEAYRPFKAANIESIAWLKDVVELCDDWYLDIFDVFGCFDNPIAVSDQEVSPFEEWWDGDEFFECFWVPAEDAGKEFTIEIFEEEE